MLVEGRRKRHLYGPSDSVNRHLHIGQAAEMASVVATLETGGSGNVLGTAEIVAKLEGAVDFSGRREYGVMASG
jgi:hypothetical protein